MKQKAQIRPTSRNRLALEKRTQLSEDKIAIETASDKAKTGRMAKIPLSTDSSQTIRKDRGRPDCRKRRSQPSEIRKPRSKSYNSKNLLIPSKIRTGRSRNSRQPIARLSSLKSSENRWQMAERLTLVSYLLRQASSNPRGL
jgi:hypothetical protein